MAKVSAVSTKKKVVKKAEKETGKVVKAKASKDKGGRVSKSFTIEAFIPQVVKLEGTVISRDATGIVLQHKRRASSKLMQTRLLMREVIAIPADNREAGTVTLLTSRKTIARPVQFKGVVDFSAGGCTIKTVSDGIIFLPEHAGIRVEITAEEE